LDNDLIEKIKKEFGSSSDEIISKFIDSSKTREWIYHSKVLNAIIKLSEGDKTKVDKYLKMALIDPRDVVMLADLADIK